MNFLADPDRQGRFKGRGKIEAADYIVEWFEEHELKPFFGESYIQDVPDLANQERKSVGLNLGAVVLGTDPILRDEYIIINAHYDHLGRRFGQIYPGADDNASGVAMLLELAVRFQKQPPRRSIAFVSFDLEEYLLWGSRWFLAHAPIPQEQICACITADMIGRSLGGLDAPTVFVMGAEKSPQLRAALNAVQIPQGLELAELGVDIVGPRSDYAPFWMEEIPFLFFSTGEHPDYHRPTDTANKIDFEKLAHITELMGNVVERLGNEDDRPTWQPEQDIFLHEAETVHKVTKTLLDADAAGDYPLSNTQRFFVSQLYRKTQFVLMKGEMSPQERDWLVHATRILMLSTF